jgi:hypothetical protein
MRMRIVLVLCAVFAVTVGVATANADKGGNSANAKLCQKGGWVDQQGFDGTQFTSEEQCVAFAAAGGTIVPIPPSVTLSFAPDSRDPGDCVSIVNLSHFAANTRYPFEDDLFLNGALYGGASGSFTTDSSGAFSSALDGALFSDGSMTERVTVGIVSSGTVTVSC